jgi:hypothetical protein
MGICGFIKYKQKFSCRSVEEYARLELVVKRESASTMAGFDS